MDIAIISLTLLSHEHCTIMGGAGGLMTFVVSCHEDDISSGRCNHFVDLIVI